MANFPMMVAERQVAPYIVFFAGLGPNGDGRWVVERHDGEVVAEGSLEAMLALVPLFEGSRRATQAEDMLRFRPEIFDLQYTYGARKPG